MNYDIEAKPTDYKGITLRSRLEAKWAVFFDLCQWTWTYEPCSPGIGGWNPDFLLERPFDNAKGWPAHYFKALIEVKPITMFDQSTADKTATAYKTSVNSPAVGNLYLLGLAPLQHGIGWCRNVRGGRWHESHMDPSFTAIGVNDLRRIWRETEGFIF